MASFADVRLARRAIREDGRHRPSAVGLLLLDDELRVLRPVRGHHASDLVRGYVRDDPCSTGFFRHRRLLGICRAVRHRTVDRNITGSGVAKSIKIRAGHHGVANTGTQYSIPREIGIVSPQFGAAAAVAKAPLSVLLYRGAPPPRGDGTTLLGRMCASSLRSSP